MTKQERADYWDAALARSAGDFTEKERQPIPQIKTKEPEKTLDEKIRRTVWTKNGNGPLTKYIIPKE